MKKIVYAAVGAAAALGLTGCGDWTSSPYPTGEITELAEKDEWVEYDCTIDGSGNIEPESCEASYVKDCYMVRFVTSDGVEFADCTDQRTYQSLKQGDTYTDD